MLLITAVKASYGYDQRLEVFGSKGQASAANDTPTNVSFIDENGNSSDKPLYFFLERYMQSFTDEMTQFIDCVVNEQTNPNNGLRWFGSTSSRSCCKEIR